MNDIDWPHLHIYTPPGAEPMTFERLSMPEFVYGFMHMVDQTEARFDRRVMWNVLKLLLGARITRRKRSVFVVESATDRVLACETRTKTRGGAPETDSHSGYSAN